VVIYTKSTARKDTVLWNKKQQDGKAKCIFRLQFDISVETIYKHTTFIWNFLRIKALVYVL
jgi:hypothetical protein